MNEVIEALRAGFTTTPHHVARQHFHAGTGDFLIMPALDKRSAGVKMVMIQPDNAVRGLPVIQGAYVLFDVAAGGPVALFDGAGLTTLRTPAASAVATDVLARQGVTTLGIIGGGPQGAGHVEAMLAIRPSLRRIVVASRTEATAQRLVDELRAGVRADIEITVGDYGAAADADIVCIGTRSLQPIVAGHQVRPGTHVNAVGAYRLDMAELSGDLLAGATVTVDDREAAVAEAGDLHQAAERGEWSWDHVVGDLTDLASGRLARRHNDEITVFKSVGLAYEDLLAARLIAAKEGLVSPD